MKNYCVIRAQGLPTVNNSTFTEIKLIPERLYDDGLFEDTKILTDKKYRILGDLNYYDNRLIQAKVYKKYKLEYFCGETEIPELLPLFETVTITDEHEYTYNARHITVEKAKVQDSFNYKVTISFVNFIPYNYSVNNYLKSDYVLANKTNYYTLSFITSRTVIGFTSPKYFYTILEKETGKFTKPVKLEYKGQEYIIQTVNFDTTILTFYLSQADKNYFELCASTANGVTLTEGTTITTITEPVEYKINESNEFVDLYAVEVTLKNTKYQLDNFVETSYLFSTLDIVGVPCYMTLSGTFDSAFDAWEEEFETTVVFLLSNFKPNFEHPEVEIKDKIELNGLELPTYQVGINAMTIKIIANEVNYALIMKYAALVSNPTITYNGTVYTAIEPAKVEDKKNKDMVDLWEIDITIKYSIYNYNPYA